MGFGRLWGSALALLAAGTLVVACAQEPEDRQPGPVEPRAFDRAVPPVAGADRPDRPVTLTYYGDSLGLGAEIDQALADRFTQDTGIRVKIVPKAPSASDAYADYQRLFQAKSPAMDVLLVDVIWPGAFAEHLADLGPTLAEEARRHFPEIIRNNTVGGKLVAMPWFTDAGLLFYRKDLLERYGYGQPPATWDDLEAMARKIQEGEKPKDARFTGFVWQGSAYEGLTCNALEWQVSHGGGEIFHSETGAVNLLTPQTKAAFARAAGWVGTISPVGVTSYQEEEARHVFQGGHAAFMRNWPYAIAAGNASSSPIKGKFAVAPLPRAKTAPRAAATLGGWQLAVSRYSKHPQEAAAFVKYLTSPEVQTWRAFEGTYMPTIRAIYENAELARAHPFFSIMPAVLDQAVARPSNRTKDLYNEASTIYFRGVAEILQGADPDVVLGRMQGELEAMLRD
ncbi:MAG: ABC transporter substrate-binding protein [Candidatus Sericytochromatia bacterium]